MSLRARRLWRTLVALVHALALVLAVSSASAEKLKVYTKPIEPFSFEQNGKAVGFSIDLWERLAKEIGADYEITWTKSVGELVDALKKKDADIAVAAISITS